MKVTKKSWKMEWVDLDGQGPATTYYRKADIVHALTHYGHDVNATPKTELNPYTDAGFFVSHQVRPYRTIR